jgi:hypothetical protein
MMSDALTPENFERAKKINYWLAGDKRRVPAQDAAWLFKVCERYGRLIPAKKRNGSPLGYAYELRMVGDPYGYVVESHTARLARRMGRRFMKPVDGSPNIEEKMEIDDQVLMNDSLILLSLLAGRICCANGDAPHTLPSQLAKAYKEETGDRIHIKDGRITKIVKIFKSHAKSWLSPGVANPQ